MQTGHIGVYEFCKRTGREVTAVYKMLLTGVITGQKVGNGKRHVWQIAESEVSKWKRESSGA